MSKSKIATAVRVAVAPVIEVLEDRRLLSATITITNTDNLVGTNRLIFNKIQTLDTKVPNVTHDKVTLTITNSGDQPLTLGTISKNGPWTLLTDPSGAVLAPGQATPLTIQFTENKLPPHPVNETNFTTNTNGGAAITGSLVIPSNDPAHPSSAYTLAGYWQSQSEHNAEPNLTVITNMLAGYGTSISNGYKVDLTETNGATREGSEVLSDEWTAANPAAPVTVRQLAGFHTEGNVVHTYWFTGDVNAQVTHQLFASLPNEGQTLLPHNSGGGALASSFSPGATPFGFKVDNEWSFDAINNKLGNAAGGGHHMRFFPLVDSSGNAVPNTWLVAMDYAVIQTENFDFQDNVYIVTNMAPATAPAAPTNLVASAGIHPVLNWDAVSFPGLVGYNVYRSITGPNGTFTQLSPDPANSNVSTTTNSFTDSTNVTAGAIYYRVTAVALVSNNPVESGPATTSANSPGPTAVDDTGFFTQQDSPLVVNVLANDFVAAGAINPASVTILTSNHGSAVVDSSGNVTYTPTGGFTGTETFTYNFRDTNNNLSNTATATVTVNPTTATGNPIAQDVAASDLAAAAISISPSATDSDGNTITPANVTITSQPANGTAAFDPESGNIIYTPADGAAFVGSDSFKYSVTDSNNKTSNTATVSLNVGVEISSSSKTARRLTYTDSSGSKPTVIITGGTADVFFNGVGNVQAPSHGLITIVSVSNVTIDNVALSGTTAGSALIIVTKGNTGSFTLGGVTDTGTVGRIIAPKGNLIGNVGTTTVDVGGLSVMSVLSTMNAIIDVGNGVATGPVFVLGPVTNGTINANNGTVRLIKATKWINTSNGNLGINATSLGTLLITGAKNVAGDFQPNLDVGSLNVASIAGQVSLGSWDISGNTRAIVVGSAANTWNVNDGGALNALIVRAGGMPADINTATLGTVMVTGNLSDQITVTGGNARVIRATGAIIDSTIAVEAGDLLALVAGSMNNSNVTVGAVSKSFANLATAADVGSNTLTTVVLTSHAANAFSGSTIIAHTIKNSSLGNIDTTTAGGLGAATFSSVNMIAGGTHVHLGPSQLSTPGTLTSFNGTSFGSVEIKILGA
jgi:hypothetical protein